MDGLKKEVIGISETKKEKFSAIFSNEEATAYAKVSVQVEGLKVTPYAEELVRRKLKGEITEEQMVELYYRYIGLDMPKP